MISGQRSPAQNGQYSAPTYVTTGFPAAPRSIVARTGVGSVLAVPRPTWSRAVGSTPVTAATSDAGAGSFGALELLETSKGRAAINATITTTISATAIVTMRRWRV